MIDLPLYNLNDSEFQLALSEFTNNFHYDLHLLNELSCNPFSLNNMVTDSGDLDPDHHFYNSNTNQACYYLLVDDFSLKYHEYKDNNHFSLIHINARSLSKNFEEISNYLSLLNHEFSVIGISETCLTNLTSDQFNMPNFEFISCCRDKRQGGGTGLYVNTKLYVRVRHDLGVNDDDICQSQFVELTLRNKTIIIGIIYRPPNGNLHKFVDYLNEELDLLDKTNKSIYLMGDFNINMLNVDSKTCFFRFFHTMI